MHSTPDQKYVYYVYEGNAVENAVMRKEILDKNSHLKQTSFTSTLDWQKGSETIPIVLSVIFMTHQARMNSTTFTGLEHSPWDYKTITKWSSVIYSSRARIWTNVLAKIKAINSKKLWTRYTILNHQE